MRRVAAFVTAMLVALAFSGANASPVIPAETGRFYNILPPGEHGSAGAIDALRYEGQGQLPAHYDDQLGMYANLVYNSPGLSDSQIETYFKKASFTVPPADVTRTESLRPTLTIVRDTYDVPHVYGDSAADVFYGAGYVNGEDRLFLTDVLRHVGRGRLAEFLGASDSNLAMDRSIARVAGYSEAELQLQFDLLAPKFGATGVLTQEAIKNYVDGLNGWLVAALADPTQLPAEYAALQVVPQPFKVTDVVAVATLIQATFAAGGGGELANARLQQALAGKYPPAVAKGIYRDLLNREDPGAPVTTKKSFPYQADTPVDPASIAIPDAGTFAGRDPLVTLKDTLRAAGIPVPNAMSNFIAVNANRTHDGHPIAVMGPQTGYFSPNLLEEVDLHGGGYDARGATFAGLGMFVLLGRGKDFAWSATSGESDMVDIRVEKLCEPGGGAPTMASTNYSIYGVCTPMYERTDRYVAKPSAGGIAEPEVITQQIERTAHGPVIGRAKVNGVPVALSLQRSTFFGEADAAPSFILLNSNQVHDPESFFHAMSLETGSFNWVYVDAEHVAWYHSGLYPNRAPGVPNDLPTWGTGEWEWDGWVSADDHPHVVDPKGGWIANWNNKPAREWRSADAQYGYNDVHRVQSLMDRVAPLAAAGDVKITDMIDAMEGAATVDLRGSQVLPSALGVLDSVSDPDVAPYSTLLQDWLATGAHHVATSRATPYLQQSAIALMDAWYERLIHAVFDPQLEGLYDAIPLGFDDTNRINHIGSSYQDGFEAYLQKAFKARLGLPVAAPFAQLACGSSLGACRAALKSSLLDAVSALQAKFGGGPSTWKADKELETIKFSAIGLVAVPDIDWQNRPTFQQVVQVFCDRSAAC